MIWVSPASGKGKLIHCFCFCPSCWTHLLGDVGEQSSNTYRKVIWVRTASELNHTMVIVKLLCWTWHSKERCYFFHKKLGGVTTKIASQGCIWYCTAHYIRLRWLWKVQVTSSSLLGRTGLGRHGQSYANFTCIISLILLLLLFFLSLCGVLLNSP